MTDDLHTKYRPTSLDELVGQKHIVESLKSVLDNKTSRSFLFTGPSGVGKTTLARIIAKSVNCDNSNIIEIDAATFTGIDSMRKITESLRYKAFGKSPAKVLIVDECHSLSKQAWQSLLKKIEEPPPHVYWCLCTTEINKVPETIKTRCVQYQLKSVGQNDLYDLLVDISGKEKIDDDTESFRKILSLISREANGSPRQALVFLGMCADAKDAQEAREILDREKLGTKEVIDLARLLLKGQGVTWAKVMAIIESIEAEEPERIRIMLSSYFAAALKKVKSEKEVPRILSLLECFSQPIMQTDKWTPLLTSLGEAIYGDER